VEGMDDGDRVR